MRKSAFSKVICVLIAVLTAMCLFGCDNKGGEEENGFNDKVEVTGYGLHISENGWITLNGQPFYGMGYVFKDAFTMRLENPSANLEPYFSKLKEAGVPYVRIMFGADKTENFEKYKTNSQEYFLAMDYVVETAEKYNVGIVATLFWDIEACAAAYGDNLKKITTSADSESYKYAVEYIKAIVTRYCNSKSLWAWEIANEGNLMCEVKKFTVEYKDGSTYQSTFTTDMLEDFYEYTSTEIRKYDAYRMIINGDASPRFYSKSLRDDYYSAPWDTYDDTVETFSMYSAGSVDCLSVHTPYISYLEWYTNAAKQLKKGIYVGAFCGTLNTNLDESVKPEDDVFEANERESFNAYVDAYVEYGVQMATVKNFASYAVDPNDDASVEVGTTGGITRNTYVWDKIKEVNEKYVSEGKNQSEGYWG